MGEKIFKTFEEQIFGLKQKNLIFKEESFALHTLQKINYYSLINGYKEIFIDFSYKKNDINDSEEKYVNNTSFEDIYWLYYFDQELRNLLLKFIFNFENNIKTKIIYYFSEHYKNDNNAYLISTNFEQNSSLDNNIKELIKKITNTINKQKSISGSRINHFSKKYTTIPLWVLMPQLDFGTTIYFYRCCKHSIQSKITRHLKNDFLKEYPEINNKFLFDEKNFENILFFINSFRNICAHNERLYNHRFRKHSINTILHKILNLKFNYSIFDLILILKIFMTNREYKTLFLPSLLKLLGFLKKNIGEKRYIKILNKMKFPRNWERIL